jgi:hypothetical protein
MPAAGAVDKLLPWMVIKNGLEPAETTAPRRD